MKTVELRDISKSYQNRQIFSHLTLEIGEGECFGCLGPSGAGKTTLLRILIGQLKADHGESFLLGETSLNLSREVFRNIGLVLDEQGLYQRLSAYDNLKIYAQIHGVDENNILRILEKVNLKDEAFKKVFQFSKGMKQRLVVARALMHKPKAVFLDEPTCGLDPVSTHLIHDLLLELKKQKTTIFLTTHNMNEATLLCDFIGLLHEGGFIEYGSVKDILHKYNQQSVFQIELKDHSQVQLKNSKESAEKIYSYLKEEKIAAMHSCDVTLEDIFIKLTGKRLDI